ncbi:hypothetical protein DERF_005901 [Dermatophagoides farinae]|uniref:Uncharacterized protein n=1 Tax=Dermatophagoides farinae TaxID=6954 RepID=A0A922I6D0_DERFA|nr:hypothetical protein DERF_005901 [Dermatophagoides farinae]
MHVIQVVRAVKVGRLSSLSSSTTIMITKNRSDNITNRLILRVISFIHSSYLFPRNQSRECDDNDDYLKIYFFVFKQPPPTTTTITITITTRTNDDQKQLCVQIGFKKRTKKSKI